MVANLIPLAVAVSRALPSGEWSIPLRTLVTAGVVVAYGWFMVALWRSGPRK